MVGQVGGRTEDVAVRGDYAYVAVGLRLVVLDVSEPVTPTEIGSTMPFPQFVEGATPLTLSSPPPYRARPAPSASWRSSPTQKMRAGCTRLL